ncbi:MAG TPA: YggT family protein [Marmoricola sp.]
MHPVGQAIELVIWTFIFLMLIRFVVDWIQVFARSWTPRGLVLVVLEAVYSATDPPIKAFRRVFKPVRIGSISLDLSFLAVLLICYLLLAINRMVWAA